MRKRKVNGWIILSLILEFDCRSSGYFLFKGQVVLHVRVNTLPDISCDKSVSFKRTRARHDN
jgi:hypothetical protein